MTAPGAPAVARHWWTQKRWWVALMLCAVTLIGYVDRLALSVAAPVIRREFGVSLTAAFSQPVIGWTIDRYSYDSVFVAVSLMHIVSALCIMGLVRRIEPLKPKGEAAVPA